MQNFYREVDLMEKIKIIKIVISVILCDAGEATRAMEIADGIKKYCPDGYDTEIIFLSNGSRFENKIISEGFTIYKCEPQLPGIGFHNDLKPTNINIIGDISLAEKMIYGEIKALKELKPHIVIYGFNPIAGLARRMIHKEIPGICYLPIPLCREMVTTNLMRDIPDMAKPITYLPKRIRKAILKTIPKSLKLNFPTFRQKNISEALKKFDWSQNQKKPDNLFDMLESNMTIINDFKEFYKDSKMPKNFKITGPLYAPPLNDKPIDEKILNIFSNENKRLKIFCSLGSSGKKEYLLEAIKSLITGIGAKKWSAVILSLPSVCSIDEALACAGNNENIYITDKFVPAVLVNSMADILISHGGQGTLQTGIYSGTPIVGFAMQPEQQINLDNIVSFGGAIRIPIHMWNARNIQKAIVKISNDKAYKENINLLRNKLKAYDGKKNAAEAIWNYILACIVK